MELIEICGGISAGKTTLASLFTGSSITPIYEDFKKSPFWEAFYASPGKYIFETELSFILLHYHQIKKENEANHQGLLCDFSFLLDLAYAKIGLFGSRFRAFECVLTEIRNELPAPSLYVFLDCDAETQLRRIKNRRRPEEKLITVDFLESLNTALKAEISKINPSKLITINSAQKDFANDESVKKEMKALIAGFIHKRNPNF